MDIIFVNGTFDILHSGHLRMLNYAKSLGSKLVVAIDSDKRVKSKKGYSRPINTQEERKEFLENLKSVDEVHIFETNEDICNIIELTGCTIIVKGSDHKKGNPEGKHLVNDIVWFDRIDEYSTTKKIEDIINR